MHRRIAIAVAGVVLALGLVAAGCSGGDDAATTTVPAPTAQATTAAAPTTVPAARAPAVGVQDDRMIWLQEQPAERMKKAAALGVKLVRVDLRWDLVALARPQRPTDPADPAYTWGRYDEIVAAAREHHIQVVFTVWGTPSWSRVDDPAVVDAKDFPDQPFGARPRDPADAGRFAQAAATRYAPRGVHLWEAWNEPNGPMFLRPQYRREGDRWVPESPRVYAQILSAMYTGIKRADPDATVAGGVTAPVGDRDVANCPLAKQNCRVTPQAFVAALDAPDLRPPMDAYAHHPYPSRPPSDSINPNAGYVDLYSLSVLTTLMDEGYLRGKPVWVTEFGVATKDVPNYHFFRTPELQKEYLVDALRRVRANPRVAMFVWYLLQDNGSWASGLYDEAGRPKPAAAEMRAQAGG